MPVFFPSLELGLRRIVFTKQKCGELISRCISHTVPSCDKVPDTNSVREEGFILVSFCVFGSVDDYVGGRNFWVLKKQGEVEGDQELNNP